METDKILNGVCHNETTSKQRLYQEAPRWRRCLVMFASAYLQGMTMGTVVGLSVMYAELIAVFNASRSQVVLLQSIFVVLLCGGVIASGRSYHQNKLFSLTRLYQEAPRWRRCLVMFASAYLQGMTMGTVVGLSVMYAELIAVFNASRSQVVLLQSIFVVLLCGGGMLTSPILKRFGPGPSVIAGSVVGAIAFIVASLVNSLVVITFTVGIVAGLGLSVAFLASNISVSWIFHDDPGSALAFLSIGNSLGQCVMPSVIEWFVEMYRWYGAFMLLGAVTLLCVPCGCYIYTCREFYKTDMDEKEMTLIEGIKKIFDVSLLTDIAMVLFLIDVFFLTLIGVVPGFLVDLMASRGLSRDKGSELLSVFGLGLTIGSIIGFLIRLKIRVMAVCHWVYIWLLVSLSFFFVITVRAYWWLLAVVLLCGVTYGAAISLRYTITLELGGLARFPQASALTNIMTGLGGFGGYTIGGVIKDVTGYYDIVFYVCAVAGLYISVTSVIMTVICRRREGKLAMDSKHVTTEYTKLP